MTIPPIHVRVVDDDAEPGQIPIRVKLVGLALDGAEDGQVPVYDAASGTWIPGSAGGGGLPILNANADPVIRLDANDNIELVGYDEADEEKGLYQFLLNGNPQIYGEDAQATLTTGLEDADANLLFTAKSSGIWGNNLSLEYEETGALSVSVGSSGNAILVTFEGGVTTADDVIGAIQAHGIADSRINVEQAPGNDGSGLITSMSQTNLSGGKSSLRLSGGLSLLGDDVYIDGSGRLNLDRVRATNDVIGGSELTGDGGVRLRGDSPQIEAVGANDDYDLKIKPKGTGRVTMTSAIVVDEVEFDGQDGNAGDVLTTDGAGAATFQPPAGGSSLVDPTNIVQTLADPPRPWIVIPPFGVKVFNEFFTANAVGAFLTDVVPTVAATGLILNDVVGVLGNITVVDVDTENVDLPDLEIVGGALVIEDASVTGITAPALRATGGRVQIASTSIAALPLATLEVVGLVELQVQANGSLTELDLTGLRRVFGSISIQSNAALSDVTVPVGLELIWGDVSFSTCALTQASVDAILVALAALDGTGGTVTYDNHVIELDGGTNATPGAAGIAAKATLELRGNTVTVN